MNALSTLISSTFSIPIVPLILAVLFLVVVVLIALFVMVIQFGTKIRNLTYPVYDHVMKEAQHKANRILEDAEEQSRAIRAKTQIEAGKLLVDRKKEDEVLRVEHVRQIEEITTHAKDILNKQVATIHQLSEGIAVEFKKYSDEANVALGEESRAIKKVATEEAENIRQSLSALDSNAQKEYEKLVNENRKQISEGVAKEIQTVRDVIASYKKDRFDLLDEQIVSLVEEVARIALNKTISLEEHTDLVLTALNDAKSEGIFGK